MFLTHTLPPLNTIQIETCIVYLDDLIMFSNKLEDIILHVDEVLTSLTDFGVTLNINKCHLFKSRTLISQS